MVQVHSHLLTHSVNNVPAIVMRYIVASLSQCNIITQHGRQCHKMVVELHGLRSKLLFLVKV